MVSIPILPGVVEKTIATQRIATRVLFAGPDTGTPILFLHGNVTSATWWEEVMLSLPAGYRGIAPDQRGFGAADPGQKIDATRGMGDLVDDALALLDHLAIDRVHVVGNSIGGSVVWRLLMAAPERLRTVTLVNPGSPFGFGGTKDETGTPCFDDFAGSGGGLTNPELLRLIAAGDASLDHPFSPRAALRMLVYKPPFVPAREDESSGGNPADPHRARRLARGQRGIPQLALCRAGPLGYRERGFTQIRRRYRQPVRDRDETPGAVGPRQ